MKPEPLPRFDEDRANCTFTMRVPRTYLTPEKREEICRRRFLWGVDVYTDDSDALATAIHAGWIRGEWSHDVDEEMLELTGESNGSGEKASRGRKVQAQPEMEIPDIMNEPLPTGPIVPPKDLDAHITLLLLPPLEKYASVTRNGLKSREWGGNHDGLSFMVLRIEWVDEGIWDGGRTEERSGKARRQRLAELAGERRGVEEKIRMAKEREREKMKKRRRVEAVEVEGKLNEDEKENAENGAGTNGVNGDALMVGAEEVVGCDD